MSSSAREEIGSSPSDIDVSRRTFEASQGLDGENDRHMIVLNPHETPSLYAFGNEPPRQLIGGDVLVSANPLPWSMQWRAAADVVVCAFEARSLIDFAHRHAGIVLDEPQLTMMPRFRDPLLCWGALALAGCDGSQRSDLLHPFLLRLTWNLARRRLEGQLSNEGVQPGSLQPVDLVAHPPGLVDPRLLRVLEHIEENIAEPLEVEQLADVAGISRYHFAKVFRLAIGETTHRYVMARRVRHARTMLRTTRLDLTSIAYACGFSSHSHMTRTFKKVVGLTPREYRESAL